jgi:hypothetical protein
MNRTLFNNNNNNNHPLIENSNQYFSERKYLSIHSEDRDFLKYPNSSEFEILLPQEYLNVASARLYSWSFPANYDVFSAFTHNIIMTFKCLTLYNPADHEVSDPLLEAIFAALYDNLDNEYTITIESGFYNPEQISTELTNKFNEAITKVIIQFLDDPVNAVKYAQGKGLFKEYNRFRIVYNNVSQKLWFGNTADKFVLTNDSSVYYNQNFIDPVCIRKNVLPQYNNWGLPSYLGFERCSVYALSVEESTAVINNKSIPLSEPSISKILKVPRFYYGDSVAGIGDNGFWLLPGAPDAPVYFLEAPFKISFMGPSYIYMEVDGMNCIDETSPWNFSEFTVHSNKTNSIVNSSFAKISVPTTPMSQWFDESMTPYKYWNPPAERISKLKIKFRYHNGQLVNFGVFEYSFMIELNLLNPQQERSYSIRDAQSLNQLQSYTSRFI